MISVTVDTVIFFRKATQEITHLLLIQRKNDPFQGKWALPGGFVEETDKSLAHAASRELHEETGLEIIPTRLWQVGSWGSPDRDPRGYTVTTAFFGVTNDRSPVVGKDDAARAAWVRVSDGLDLAFDHNEIVNRALLKATC